MRIVLSLMMITRASLTINKYLEEFPGLVHFLYIDRFNHRITAPSLDFTSEETTSLTKKKVRILEYFRNSSYILQLSTFTVHEIGFVNISKSTRSC